MCMFPTPGKRDRSSPFMPAGGPIPDRDGLRASDLLLAAKPEPRPGLERRPKQADGGSALAPVPPDKPLGDRPLSEWDLHPIVDDGTIRGVDSQGSGAFGASRKRGDKREPHGGVDIAVPVGTLVRAPAAGTVAFFHPKPGLIGIQITTPDKRILKVIYVAPIDRIVVGSFVRPGQPIGHSQSLQQAYPGITDHVHFQVERRDQEPADLVDPTEIVRQWFAPPND